MVYVVILAKPTVECLAMLMTWLLYHLLFLVSVCVLLVSKALLISSATVLVRAGGAIWLNLFAMVLFTVCSAVNV